jgi:hypothetical protein
MPTKPSADELMSLLKSFGACPENSCSNKMSEDHHCQSYVGPMFGCRERVLIVGLDQGKPDTEEAPCLNLERRRQQILSFQDAEKYSDTERNWNGHYRGSVRVASLILGMECVTRCHNRCFRDPNPQHCALTHFVQANVVKSVPRINVDMTFKQSAKIVPSMQALLDEILVIQPSVVVLQGVKIHGPFISATRVSGRHRLSKVCDDLPLHFVKWNHGGGTDESFHSYVACFHHPSRGHLEKQWDDVIVPTVRLLSSLLKSPSEASTPY